MIIYVDIDETICITPDDRDYSKAVPIRENIDKINDMHDRGNTIIYWTARGNTTGKSWLEVTKGQLDRWDAKYDEIKMDKPYYDLFICDKAVNTSRFFSKETQ